jgi:uncharacterized membrane protein YkvA (DUF1232 family)
VSCDGIHAASHAATIVIDERLGRGKVLSMAARPGSWLVKPVLLRTLLDQARLALRLVREPAVPTVIKAIPAVGGAYLVWPIDILPDLLPIIGQLDDIGVVMASLALFVRLCPDALVAFHRDAMNAGRKYSPIQGLARDIDAEFRRG